MEFEYNLVNNKSKISWYFLTLSLNKKIIIKKRKVTNINLYILTLIYFLIILLYLVLALLNKLSIIIGIIDYILTLYLIGVPLLFIYYYLYYLFQSKGDKGKIIVNKNEIIDSFNGTKYSYTYDNIEAIIIKDNFVLLYIKKSKICNYMILNNSDISKFVKEVNKNSNNLIIKSN